MKEIKKITGIIMAGIFVISSMWFMNVDDVYAYVYTCHYGSNNTAYADLCNEPQPYFTLADQNRNPRNLRVDVNGATSVAWYDNIPIISLVDCALNAGKFRVESLSLETIVKAGDVSDKGYGYGYSQLGQYCMRPAGKTLHYKHEQASGTVTADSYGATSRTYTYKIDTQGITPYLILPKVKRTGYVFKGWSIGYETGATTFVEAQNGVLVEVGNNKGRSVQILADGWQCIYIGAYTDYSTIRAIWEDEEKPSGTIRATPGGWTSGNVSIDVNAADAGSGIKSIEIFNGNGERVSVSYSNTAGYADSSQGVETYKAKISDNAGNVTNLAITDYIDKTLPVIKTGTNGTPVYEDSNTILVESGYIRLNVYDELSGIKYIKLFHEDGREVKYDEGLRITGNSISFNTGISNETMWTLNVCDNAGNMTSKRIHTPYNFSVTASLDNGLNNTTSLLCGSEAVLKINTYGYVEKVEIEFDGYSEGCANREGYSLNRIISDGNAYIWNSPAENNNLDYFWKVPDSLGNYRMGGIKVTAWRGGYKKSVVLDFSCITVQELANKIAPYFRRTIVNSTWDRK